MKAFSVISCVFTLWVSATNANKCPYSPKHTRQYHNGYVASMDVSDNKNHCKKGGEFGCDFSQQVFWLGNHKTFGTFQEDHQRKFVPADDKAVTFELNKKSKTAYIKGTFKRSCLVGEYTNGGEECKVECDDFFDEKEFFYADIELTNYDPKLCQKKWSDKYVSCPKDTNHYECYKNTSPQKGACKWETFDGLDGFLHNFPSVSEEGKFATYIVANNKKDDRYHGPPVCGYGANYHTKLYGCGFWFTACEASFDTDSNDWIKTEHCFNGDMNFDIKPKVEDPEEFGPICSPEDGNVRVCAYHHNRCHRTHEDWYKEPKSDNVDDHFMWIKGKGGQLSLIPEYRSLKQTTITESIKYTISSKEEKQRYVAIHTTKDKLNRIDTLRFNGILENRAEFSERYRVNLLVSNNFGSDQCIGDRINGASDGFNTGQYNSQYEKEAQYSPDEAPYMCPKSEGYFNHDNKDKIPNWKTWTYFAEQSLESRLVLLNPNNNKPKLDGEGQEQFCYIKQRFEMEGKSRAAMAQLGKGASGKKNGCSNKKDDSDAPLGFSEWCFLTDCQGADMEHFQDSICDFNIVIDCCDAPQEFCPPIPPHCVLKP